MIHWKTIPLLLLTLSFCIGIIVMRYFDLSFAVMLIGVLLCTTLIVILHRSASKRVYFHATSLVLFVLMGGFWYKSSLPEHKASHYSHYIQSDKTMMVLSVKNVGLTQKGKTKIQASVIGVLDQNSQLKPTSGAIIIYSDLPKAAITYGSTAWVQTTPKPIPETPNPYSFDYKAFLAQQHIYFQGYVRSTDWHDLNRFSGNRIVRMAQRMREAAYGKLDQALQDSVALGVASALILGDKSLLQEETREDYARTGASHVLAVSGLHCGIVAGVLLYLLQFIRRQTLSVRLIKVTIALIGLWLFALVTGLAPSVLRASIMFSFLLVGRLLLFRKVNLYNIIALSALLMMIHDPMIVFSISFQLSYSALIGIIALQDKIYKLVFFPYPFLNKIWELVTVSIAAQIGTLPFTLHYFHFFPFYFWLSGIVVVPLAAIILKSGLLTVGLSLVSPDWGKIPAWILHQSITIMNTSVEACRQLPSIDLTDIYLNSVQLLCISLSTVALLIGWSLYSKKWIWISVYCLMGFSGATLAKTLQQSSQCIIQTYSVDQDILVDVYRGYNCVCYTNLEPNDPRIHNATAGNRGHHGISNCRYEAVSQNVNVIEFIGGQSVSNVLYLKDKGISQRIDLKSLNDVKL